MSDHQITSTPLTRRYGRLGASTGRQIAPLHSLRIFLFGVGGQGKTAFLQSNPNLLIINCDQSGSTSQDPVAAIWPPIDNQTGRAIMDLDPASGKPTRFDYAAIRKTIHLLKEMAVANEERPLVVAIDSLTQLVELIKDWVVQNARALNLVGEGATVTEFSQLMGQAAWDRVYSQVVEILDELKQHGYGVVLVGHTANEKIAVGDNAFTYKPVLTMGKGLWTRLQPRLDMSAMIRMEEQDVIEEYDAVVNGKTIKKNRTAKKQIYTFDVQDILFAGITKKRLAEMKTKIVLPPKGSWAVVEAEYKRAVAQYMAGA